MECSGLVTFESSVVFANASLNAYDTQFQGNVTTLGLTTMNFYNVQFGVLLAFSTVLIGGDLSSTSFFSCVFLVTSTLRVTPNPNGILGVAATATTFFTADFHGFSTATVSIRLTGCALGMVTSDYVTVQADGVQCGTWTMGPQNQVTVLGGLFGQVLIGNSSVVALYDSTILVQLTIGSLNQIVLSSVGVEVNPWVVGFNSHIQAFSCAFGASVSLHIGPQSTLDAFQSTFLVSTPKSIRAAATGRIRLLDSYFVQVALDPASPGAIDRTVWILTNVTSVSNRGHATPQPTTVLLLPSYSTNQYVVSLTQVVSTPPRFNDFGPIVVGSKIDNAFQFYDLSLNGTHTFDVMVRLKT
jgi:hypothetical protein